MAVMFALVLSGCASTSTQGSINGNKSVNHGEQKGRVYDEEKTPPNKVTLGGRAISPEALAVLKTSRLPAVPTDPVERASLKGAQDLEAAEQKQREIDAYCKASKNLNCEQPQQRSGWRPPNPLESVGSLLLGGWLVSSSSSLYGYYGGTGGVNFWGPGLGMLAIYPLTRMMYGSK